MKTPVFIRVFNGDQLVEVKQFTQDQIILGQDESATLRLSDPLVSPIHAMIERRGEQYHVCDLGSQTGTFANGNKVVDQSLSSGDEIRVGALRLEFFVGIPKLKGAPPPPPNVEPTPPPIVVDSETLEIPPMIPQAADSDEETEEIQELPARTPRRPVAPASSGSAEDSPVIHAGSGPDVQVIVAWRSHILSTSRFSKRGNITMGAEGGADILLPLLAGRGKQTLLLNSGGGWQVVPLNQSLRPGDVLRVDFDNYVSVYVSLADTTQTPLMAPWLNFTSSELTAFVVSLVFVGLLALYMGLYTPPQSLEDDELENLARVAILMNEKLPDIKPTPQPIKKENPIVKEEKPAAKPQTNADEGKISEVRPKKLDQKKPKTLTSVKQGGSIKTSPKEGANAQSVQKDVKKEGLLATFGAKGAQAQLDQAFGGAGETHGLANQATGVAGSNTDRPGEGLGSQFKDTGAGGKGTATQGLAGVGRGGNGFGNKGYGTGGLGAKTGTLVLPGGQGEEFVGTIDKDAIRRVVMAHIEEVRFCYEQVLNSDQSAAGRVKITWQFGAGGVVVSASVKEAPENLKGVANCIVMRLRAWIFPEPPAGTVPTVSYPFVFERK